MTIFSKACEYAIKIMIYIADLELEGKKIGIKQIAQDTEVPEPFAAKILQQLVKNSLLLSFKGPKGGFQLVKGDITLYSIVQAIDGKDIVERCILGLSDCSNQNPCPVHSRYVLIREQLKDTLFSTKIRDFEF